MQKKNREIEGEKMQKKNRTHPLDQPLSSLMCSLVQPCQRAILNIVFYVSSLHDLILRLPDELLLLAGHHSQDSTLHGVPQAQVGPGKGVE